MREIDEETRKRYVDEDNKLSAVQGGLIVFLIMPAICLWIVYERNNPYGDSAIYMIAILLSIPAVFIIGYVVRVRFYSKEKRLVLGQVKNKANQAKDALISTLLLLPSLFC